MKTEDIFDLIEKNIQTLSPVFANMIQHLTEKMMIADGNNIIKDDNGNVLHMITDEDKEDIDDETYDKLSHVENFLFNAFANIIKAKEAMEIELELPEMILKTQYDAEMNEAMEMYREFRNTEEILKEGEEKTEGEIEENKDN